jgi:septal ring-binding cell division protein DamX
MHQHKKGTLLMLDSNLRHLPAQPNGSPSASPSPSHAAEVPKSSEPEKADGGKGRKKRKHAKYRAEIKGELSRIAEALRQLRGRVSDIHALHLQRDGEGADLAHRLDTLGEEQTRALELADALGTRVNALRVEVDALSAASAVIGDTLADLAVQPDRDTALFALEDRIQEAEETLNSLRELVGQGPGRLPDDLAQQFDGFGQALVTQAGRLDELEVSLTREVADDGTLASLEQSMQTLEGSVDEQVAGLERDLATLRDQNKRWRESERAWADERLGTLRRGLVVGIGVLALLLLAGFVATWWHGERQLDLIAARIAAVEQGNEARFAALERAAQQSDISLGEALSQLGEAVQVIDATNAELAKLAAQPGPAAAPISVIGETQLAELLTRLRALEQANAPIPEVSSPSLDNASAPEAQPAVEATSEEASVPVPAAPVPEATGEAAGRADAVSAPSGPDARQMPVPEVPEEVAAASLASPAIPPEPVTAPQRYVIQLIGFRSQASIAAFADKYDIATATRWVRAPGGGRPWYRVLYGDYADRQAAEAALAALPEDLKRLSPLVRPLADGAKPLVTD